MSAQLAETPNQDPPLALPEIPTDVEIRPTNLENLYPLRREILRPDLERCDFEGDRDESTVHLGAFIGGRLVGIVSLYQEDFCAVETKQNPATHLPTPGGKTQWLIQGIAILPAFQRKGLGTKLLMACIDYVKARGGRMLWFKARKRAQDFYVKHGFTSTGDVFVWENVGEMIHMFKHL